MSAVGRPGARLEGQTRRPELFDLCRLALLGAVVTLPGLGQERNWSAREARHATIAAEIVERGDYLVPHLLGEEYPDKPPVMHAAVAALYRFCGGPSMLLARLPSALAAIVGALALYGIGLQVHGRRQALLAATAFLAVPGVGIMARTARPDMVFATLILVSYLGLLVGMEQRRGGRRVAFLAVGGLAAGLASLTKGPYGFLFPLLIAIVAPRWQRTLRRPRAREWLVFAAAFLVFPLAWAAPVYLRDGGRYLRSVLLQPDLVSGAGTHARAVYWYVVPALVSFLPLSAFLPLALRDVRRPSWQAAMAGIIFVILSLVPGKRWFYLLVWYPLAVLAVVDAIVARGDSLWVRRAGRVCVAGGLVAMPLYFVAVQPFVRPGEEPEREIALAVLESVPRDAWIVCYVGMGEELAFVAAQTRAHALARIKQAVEPRTLACYVRHAPVAGASCCLVAPDGRVEECREALVPLELRRLGRRKCGKKTWSWYLLLRSSHEAPERDGADLPDAPPPASVPTAGDGGTRSGSPR